MVIKVKQQLVNSSKYPLKCPYSMKAEFICVHNTYNDASAHNEVSYHNSNTNATSFHFAIDDKEVIQCLPINRNGFHAGDGAKGDGNRKSIGIEICYSKSGGERYEKAELLAIKFVAQLLYERGWGIDRVKSHKYFSEVGMKKGYSRFVKNCPHRILDRKDGWENFLKATQVELNKLNNKEEELTVKQYNELKELIDNQAKTIKALEDKIKEPKTTVATWASDSWDWGKKNKITDGDRPQHSTTRQEVVKMLHSLFMLLTDKK